MRDSLQRKIVNRKAIIFFTFMTVLLRCGLCDDEEFSKADKEETPVLEDVFPVDSMALNENVNIKEDSKDDTQPAFQSSKLADVDKDEVIFSVLEATKSKPEQEYLSGVMITEADLPDVNLEENKTTPVKNKTLTVDCALRVLNDDEVASVILVNSSVLLNVLTPNTTNSTLGECVVVLFYSSQCVFSARMAPHYNALARVFPGIYFFALDTAKYYSVHMRYGVVSVPNVLLFHNAKAVARFNETAINLENLVSFITKYTNLHHNGTLNVTSADMNGPVPATLTKKVDLVLILAWAFTIFCLCLWFLRSALCQRIVENVKNTWREAEAQHEHVD